jgi:DNA repair photolyase
MLRQATLPLLFVLSPALQPDPGEALVRRLRKAVCRREPIVLGTAAQPYEPAAGPWQESALRQILLRAEGLEIALTTGTPRILRELGLLVELDRRHSVAVRMIVPAAGGAPEPRLRAVRGLTAEGIATSLLLRLPAAPRGTTGEESLRFLLEEALAAGALDVEMDARSLRRGERVPLLAAFERLRLEYGFPRRASGRG